jgi:hypothetical protein
MDVQRAASSTAWHARAVSMLCTLWCIYAAGDKQVKCNQSSFIFAVLGAHLTCQTARGSHCSSRATTKRSSQHSRLQSADAMLGTHVHPSAYGRLINTSRHLQMLRLAQATAANFCGLSNGCATHQQACTPFSVNDSCDSRSCSNAPAPPAAATGVIGSMKAHGAWRMAHGAWSMSSTSHSSFLNLSGCQVLPHHA